MFSIKSKREPLRDCIFKSSLWELYRTFCVDESCVKPQSQFAFMNRLKDGGLWVFSQRNSSFPNKTFI